MPNVIDSLLKRIDPNIKYEDLNFSERETLTSWLKQLETKKLTLEMVKEHIRNLIRAVEVELIDTPEFERIWGIFPIASRKHLLLKARLKNYLLIENMLSANERAKKAIEQQLAK